MSKGNETGPLLVYVKGRDETLDEAGSNADMLALIWGRQRGGSPEVQIVERDHCFVRNDSGLVQSVSGLVFSEVVSWKSLPEILRQK